MSSFLLQGNYGTPLMAASEKGHIEIVAMLLQAEGIDVNQEVSIMISIMFPHYPPITNPYHYRYDMSVLVPFTGALWHPSRGSLEGGSYRDSSLIVTGQRD